MKSSNNTINAIIVDDEVLARINIREALKLHPKWHVMTELADGEQLQTALKHTNPDVIFLDIQMPGDNGINIARKLLQAKTKALIIFITAFNQYAVQAFELYAIDYLLKPFNDKRFAQAITRAEEHLTFSQSHNSLKNWQAKHLGTDIKIDKIIIRSSGSIRIISIKDIFFFASSGNYVEVHHEDGIHLHRVQLKFLEAKLNPQQFCRVHRSAIVKLSEVKELKSLEDNQYSVLLSNGKNVKVSSTFRTNLMNQLGID